MRAEWRQQSRPPLESARVARIRGGGCQRTIVILRALDGTIGLGETVGTLEAYRAAVAFCREWPVWDASQRMAVTERAAFSAVDCAHWDLLARSRCISLAVLLGGHLRAFVDASAEAAPAITSGGPHEIAESIISDAIDAVRTNVAQCGGIVAFQQVAALCRAYDADLCIASEPGVGISLAHDVQLGLTAAAPLRHFWMPSPLVDSGLVRPMPEAHDGRIVMPLGPGIGVELDAAAFDSRCDDQTMIDRPDWRGRT